MSRPRTVEITNNVADIEILNHSVVINGLDISDMITGCDIHIDADSFPTVTILSSPDVISFKGIALVDDPRLHTNVLGIPRTVPIEMLDGIGRHEVGGIERLRRRQANTSGATTLGSALEGDPKAMADGFRLASSLLDRLSRSGP